MSIHSENFLYHYRAKVIDGYDADTLTLVIDLGLHISVTEKVRLARINAPELRGRQREAGLAARDWVFEQIMNKDVIIRTNKDKTGKYGRYVVEIWLDGENFNDAIVAAGHAVYHDY